MYSDLMFSFQQMSDNYRTLKKETDLDRMFLEGFDEKTRIVLLKNIQELMDKTDWNTLDKLKLDELTQTQQDKATNHLREMVEEYDDFIKSKIEMLMRGLN